MPASKELAVVLENLKNAAQPVPAKDLYHLSDLNREERAAFEAVWPEIEVERRRAVLHDLGEIGEANLEVQFEAVFRIALEDEDAEVRAAAITNLWETEAPDLIAPLLEKLQHDPAGEVRAAAASALGRFMYLGEVDDLPARYVRRVAEALLAVLGGTDDVEVRRRALEAVAFSSRPEVADLIQQAYAGPDRLTRVSAVFAMGRNADERWNAPVLAELDSVDPELRFEAARAAGELELAEAVPALKRMVEEGDVQVREAAIWSLGQIGGDAAKTILLDLLREAGEDEADYLEDALENLQFHDDLADLDLFAAENGDDLDDDLLDGDDDDDLPPPARRLN